MPVPTVSVLERFDCIIMIMITIMIIMVIYRDSSIAEPQEIPYCYFILVV